MATSNMLCIFVLLYCLIVLSTGVFGLDIASFNIRIFGIKKAADLSAMQTIASIVKRYDIVLIQEVRDSSDVTVSRLINAVNNLSKPVTYQHVTSGRLGRTSSKEQYSFLYRTSSVSVKRTYQYPDDEDVFQREPFCVQFRSLQTQLSEFVLVAIHTDPDTAVAEMNALVTVHDAVKQLWRTDNILIMGDLNADCSYASKKALKELELRRNPPFTWLIDDDVDTTITNTDCAYDRFIASGTELTRNIVPDSAKVFHFDREFRLSLQQALNVSDHYPIELKLGNNRLQEDSNNLVNAVGKTYSVKCNCAQYWATFCLLWAWSSVGRL